MFLRRKKNKILYLKYLEEKNKLENTPKTIEVKSVEEDTKKVPISKKNKEQKKDINVLYKKNVISFNALENGIGTTYILMIFARYIENHLQKKVSIITDNTSNPYLHKYNVYSMSDFYLAYENSDFILIDNGTNEIEHNEMKLCNLHFMIAIHENVYLKKLYTFIQSKNNIEDWYFIFNHVPQNANKKVDALMEDYKYLIMPTTDINNLDKALVTKLNKMLRKVI